MSLKSKHISMWRKIYIKDDDGMMIQVYDLNNDGSLRQKFAKRPPRKIASFYKSFLMQNEQPQNSESQEDQSQDLSIISLSSLLNSESKPNCYKIPPISSIFEKMDLNDTFDFYQNGSDAPLFDFNIDIPLVA